MIVKNKKNRKSDSKSVPRINYRRSSGNISDGKRGSGDAGPNIPHRTLREKHQR